MSYYYWLPVKLSLHDSLSQKSTGAAVSSVVHTLQGVHLSNCAFQPSLNHVLLQLLIYNRTNTVYECCNEYTDQVDEKDALWIQ